MKSTKCMGGKRTGNKAETTNHRIFKNATKEEIFFHLVLILYYSLKTESEQTNSVFIGL